jgi:general secretion pathway protein B
MSFILDALRKSERERQQQATPGLGDAAVRPQKKTGNRWLVIVAAVLAVNATLITVLLVRDEQPPAQTRNVQPANLPRNTPAPARKPALTAPLREDIRSLEEEVLDASAEGNSPAVVAMASSEPRPPPVPERPAPAAPPSPQPSPTPDVPTMEEMVLEGSLEMNPLRLDIHVYSEQPDQRFVFINMSKYREGDATKEGPQVDTITSDGVVLSHQGKRFLLTR